MENIVWHHHTLDKQARALIKKQSPCLIWFTGLSGAGKSTIANELEYWLHRHGYHTFLLDGDNVRHGLNRDLGFSNEDREENIRRIGEVSRLFVEAGVICISAFISPFCSDRRMVRELFSPGEFIEVFVNTPLDVCETRDPKGLYQKARAGKIKDFTGIDSEYEVPEQAEITLNAADLSPEACVEKIVEYLHAHGMLLLGSAENADG